MIGSRRDVIQWLQGQNHDFYEIKEYSPKRSLSANAYYWQAVTAIAKILKVSTAYVHNKLLRECAPPVQVGNKLAYVFLPDTPEAERDTEESVTYHLRPTSQIKPGKKGQPNYRAYVLLKGSSEFDSREMAALIDRAVQSCKELEIEPPPTQDIAAALKRMETREKRAKQ